MAKTTKWPARERTLHVALALILTVATFIACGTDPPGASGDGTKNLPPFCGTPNAGCDCPNPGESVDCGSVEVRSGDYVACSLGRRTCLGGKWGVCEGTNIVTKSIAASSGAGGLHGLALGAAMACPAPPDPLANPCDPYCNQFVDTPAGLTLPGGLTVTPGGLTIPPPALVACQRPMNQAAVYAQYPVASRPNGGPPTTCTTGPDTCSLDSACGAGVCAPRAVAASSSCVGVDFTLGAPCWDGTRFTFQVCNRGSVAATSGILPIAHHIGSPSVSPSSCTIATNGPAGDCLINLTAKPLQPGSCTEITPSADCPLAVPNETGDHFYFVNRSNTGVPPIAGECNSCNNYTATNDTAMPPGVAGAACTAISCGGVGGNVGQPATSSLPNGINTCAGSADALTNPCNVGNPNKNCQQDFHCDLTTGSPTINTCVWNQTTAYSDASCNGVDLTVGAGCNQGALYSLPICNRGTRSLATGAVIRIGQANTGGYNSWNANCAGGTAVSCSVTLTAPLGPGQCFNTTACPGGNGQRYEIVNADNSIAECGAPGAGCANNAAQVKDNGSGCQTCACNSGTAELTGRILDPAKLRPVYGAAVYVPSTTVGALSGPNVQCDTCQNIYSGLPASASASTDVDGTFRLQGVPSGVAFPLVIQLGRFRRQIMVSAIPACGTAVLASAQAHLPGTKAKVGDTATDTANPDLPLIAMVTGAGDATECLLGRMGIATSEFTAPGGGGNVEMYTYKRANGLQGVAGSFGAGSQVAGGSGAADVLLATAANLNKYNALIMPCGAQAAGENPTPAMQTNLQTWMNSGGRLFASHIEVADFIRSPIGNQNDGTANWSTVLPWGSNNPDQSDRSPPFALTDTINQSFPKGAAMASWLRLAWPAPGGPGGVPPAVGQLPLTNTRNDVRNTNGAALNWFSGTSTYTGAGAGAQVNMMSFDTPFASAPAAQCGRAVLPLMHVSGNSSGIFPGFCGALPAALTGQELSFEYMMWEAMTCLAPSTVPPVAPPVTPIPPAAPLVPVTFTRDYQAVCPVGTRVEWEFFYWQAVIASGTNITFRAATASSALGLPAAPPPAAPATVPIASASSSTPLLPLNSWSQDAQTVAQHLANEPPGPAQLSQEFLRVYMTFNPSGIASPVLQSWRQTYNCVPAE